VTERNMCIVMADDILRCGRKENVQTNREQLYDERARTCITFLVTHAVLYVMGVRRWEGAIKRRSVRDEYFSTLLLENSEKEKKTSGRD